METGKHHEKHIKDAVKKVGLAQPSPDFTARVMQKIEASEQVTAYKPLIPQKGWLVIAVTSLIVIIFSFYFADQMAFDWFDLEKLSAYFTFDLSANISLSRNMVYGMLLTAAVILLQVPLLASRHSRRLWKNNY